MPSRLQPFALPLALLAGVALIFTGVWFVYWPAALIVLGTLITLLVIDEAI